MSDVVDAAEVAKPIATLTEQLDVQAARAMYWKRKHAHLRGRVRELLRALPVDLGVPAVNYRLIIVALTSERTESIDNAEEPKVRDA